MVVKKETVEIRTVSASWGQISSKAGSTESMRRVVLDWAAKRSYEPFPSLAYEGGGFELALGGGEAVSGDGVWAFRFDTADEGLRASDGIERKWRTEVVIATPEDTGAPLFSVRLSVITAVSGIPFARSAPALIREIGKIEGASFGEIPVDRSGYVAGAFDFIGWLSRRERKPVVAISGDRSDLYARLKRSLLGFAQVVRVDEDLSWRLTRALGKKWSVYEGAIRVYYPGLDPEVHTPFYHPYWKSSEIPINPSEVNAFSSRLQRRLYAESAGRPDLDDVAPGFQQIESYLLALRLKAAAENVRLANIKVDSARTNEEKVLALDSQVLALKAENEGLAKEVDSLKERIHAISSEKDFAYETAKEYEEELERIKSHLHSALSKISHLSSSLKEAGGVDGDVDLPETFDELQDWAENFFPHCLVITGKALRAAKKSVYEDVPHIYSCLKLLATEYRDMRITGDSSGFKRAADEMRVEVSDVGLAATHRRYKHQFEFPYNGGYALADLHLCPAKGTAERGSVDPRRAYRIYFHWDDQLQLVVVASLPSHLDTTLTD